KRLNDLRSDLPMIKFFRHIRQRMIKEDRISKYLLYALGEIFLVVIGILIALQINNCNDIRMQRDLSHNYIGSLRKDLAADLVYFNLQVEMDSTDLAKLQSLSKRLSSPLATMGTLIRIARFEFLPYTDIKNDLNMSTYNSLITSGNI